LGLSPLIVVAQESGGWATLTTRRPWDQAIRSRVGVVALGRLFYAVSAVPLATATTLSYAAPIFVVVLSIPILGERIGPWRWSAVGAGFIGMLLIVRPEQAALELGVMAALGSALFGALVSIWLRRLSDTEPTSTIGFYYNGAATALFLIWTSVAGWVWVEPTDLAFLLAIGATAAAQQLAQTAAFRYGEASLLAPFDYTLLIFAAAIGYFIWGETLAWTTVLGVAVIVGSGLLILRRERRGSGGAFGPRP